MFEWQPTYPIDTFFFDCDSTLSLIEGIDELAAMNGVADKVREITTRCMSDKGLTLNDYRARLSYVEPSAAQIQELGQRYRQHVAPGAQEVINVLNSLQKRVYVVSAGIQSAVSDFVQTLGVSKEHVLAVDVFTDAHGQYQGFDEASLLVQPRGKAQVLAGVLEPGIRSAMVGDGISDWEASDSVTRFVGFAGVCARSWLREHSEFYLASSELYALLPLCLTEQERQSLCATHQLFYQKGLVEIRKANVLYKGKMLCSLLS